MTRANYQVLDYKTNILSNIATPIAATDAANKAYVDSKGGLTQATADTLYVGKTGAQVMTGRLNLPELANSGSDVKLFDHVNANGKTIWGLATPTASDWAVTKGYVDTNAVLKTGAHTMTGDLTITPATGKGMVKVTSLDNYSAFEVGGTDSQAQMLTFSKNNSQRWKFIQSSSATADFQLNRYDDAGVFVSAPLSVKRADGEVTLGATSIINGVYIGRVLGGGYYGMQAKSNGGAGGSIIFGDNGGTDKNTYVIAEASGSINLRPNNATGSQVVIATNGDLTSPGKVATAKSLWLNTSGEGVYWAAPDIFMSNYGGGAVLYLLNAAASAWRDMQIGNITINGGCTVTGGLAVTNDMTWRHGTCNGLGIMYPGFTLSPPAAGGANRIAMKWGSSNIYGGVDNAANCILGTVSARKWKTGITTTKNGLDKILRLRSVEYTPKELDGTTKSHERRHGLVADEVRKVLPGAAPGTPGEVGTAGEAVNYNEIVPVLVAAVQELAAEVKALTAKVA